MKYIFDIVTPIGRGKVGVGEFMSNDGRKKKYSCWWNGCGIGGESKTLKESREYLINFIRDLLNARLKEYEDNATDLRIFLRGI